MKKKKHPLTLIEIMIVILLIGLIASVVGVNMKGSLDEGKAFKSRQAQARIADILMLEIARGASVDEVIKEPVKYLGKSGLVKAPETFIKDGWGGTFEVTEDDGQIIVKSQRLEDYNNKNK